LEQIVGALQGDRTRVFAHEISQLAHETFPRISLPTVRRNPHSSATVCRNPSQPRRGGHDRRPPRSTEPRSGDQWAV